MFKKIEIWILHVSILLGLLLSILVAILVRQGIEGRTSVGGVSIAFLTDPLVAFARGPEQILNHILKPNKMRTNDPWDSPKSYWKYKGFHGDPHTDEKYLLLSRHDGDLEQFIVELIDLKSFKVLHTWNPDINEINSLIDKSSLEFANFERDYTEKRYAIMSPFLMPNGDLIIHDDSPLIRIDLCSKLVWQNQEEKFHHSIEKDHDGNLWVPIHIFPYEGDKNLSAAKAGEYFDDGLAKVSPEGEILYKKSLSELFYENNMGHRLHGIGRESFNSDPIHLNDIEPVLEDGKYWNKGDLFLSLRAQSMIILFRPSTNKILWVGEGYFSYQHDVDIISDHKISIYDNNLKFYPNIEVNGSSYLQTYDFATDQYSTYLKNEFDQLEIKNPYQGVAELMDDNQLFFEETLNGRALLIENGKIKWQYINKASNGEIYRLGWSRIIHKAKEIEMIKNILNAKECSDG